MAACTTEPVEIHDDNAVLQKLVNDPTIECTELPDSICVWEDDRIILLNLFNQEISGQIPDEIGNLTELKQLGLKSNNLSGEIPESIGKLTNLTQLSLSNNLLSGNLPESLGNLSNLTLLDLSNNNLLGSIPNSVAELSALYTLSADSNSFSGSIPDGLCNIENLDISNNQFCSSQPVCIDSPEIMGYQDCTCSDEDKNINGYCYSQTDLTILSELIINADSINMNLDIDSSGFVDPLELGIQIWQSGRLKKLDCHWDADYCSISGNLPENIDDLDSLAYLDVQQNNITGVLPEALGNLNILEYLNISDNQLNGYIPNNFCGENSNLKEIIINNNKLCPCYPSCIEDAGVQDLSECINCDDGFTLICDDLPETVSIIEGDSLCFKTDNLAVLEAFIDSSLATLPDSLDMSMDADSSGTIEPLKLGLQIWENGNLISFDAMNHGLSGGIPANIGSLNSLFYLFISNNYLTGELPIGIYTLTNLSSLHISDNQLTGEILPVFCIILDNWETDGFNPNRSYLDNNNFCTGEDGYPDCITPFVGEQNTSNCSESESP